MMTMLPHDGVMNVLSFGVKKDGSEISTEGIQAAINAASDIGGGVVLFPAGYYQTAPIQLFSNVQLHLLPGAVIEASVNIDDYFETNFSLESSRVGLIYAVNARNVGITGSGVIDCRGPAFMDLEQLHVGSDYSKKFTRQGEVFRANPKEMDDGPVKPLDRPGNLLQFINCSKVRLEGVTILDGPDWTVHFDNADDVVVSGVTIRNNPLIPNSDGIHCTSCRNVRITHCSIEAGDDAVAITALSSTNKRCEDVIISDCHLASRSAGVRVGYGRGGVDRVLLQNLTIRSNRGIGIFVRDEGSVTNVSARNIMIHTRLHTGHWWGHGEPIHVSALRGSVDTLGMIRGVQFSQIIAESETGIVLYGTEDGIIRDVQFENVRLEVRNSPIAEGYGGNFDLRPSAQLETAIFNHNESGLFARMIHGLKIRDFSVSWDGELPEYLNHAIRVQASSNVVIDAFVGRQPHVNGSTICLYDCTQSSVKNSTAIEGTHVFLELKESEHPGLFVNNDLTRAAVPILSVGSQASVIQERRLCHDS